LSQKIHPDLALEAIRQLNRLATQPKWAHIGSEAYQHMRTLRACGFTNHQISTITGQRWKTSLVKKVTAKTSVTSPEISQHAISLLNQVVNANLTLPDLQIAIRINQETAGSKVQLTEILAFLQKLKDDKIELEKFFQDYSQMQQNQLTPRTLREAIKYKEDLEKAGFNLPALPKLKSLATKYGDPEKVLSAIESYGDLNIINKNLETTKHELEDAKKLLESADSQLKRHQDLEQLSKALVTNYHEL